MSRYAVLVGQINRNVLELTRIVRDTQTLVVKIQATGDQDYWGTVALNLHGFYSGVERIFREIALDIDDSLPEAADWHRRLLHQMAAEVPEVRPAILKDNTLALLRDLCAFRHVVRNVYTFDLIPSRVEDLAGTLPDCLEQLRADLQEFCQFLMMINGG